MWRAFFLAIGISTFIVGAECTMIDAVFVRQSAEPAPVVATYGEPASIGSLGQGQVATRPQVREIRVPEWAPWSLMGVGAVVILYSFTIPRRVNAT